MQFCAKNQLNIIARQQYFFEKPALVVGSVLMLDFSDRTGTGISKLISRCALQLRIL